MMLIGLKNRTLRRSFFAFFVFSGFCAPAVHAAELGFQVLSASQDSSRCHVAPVREEKGTPVFLAACLVPLSGGAVLEGPSPVLKTVLVGVLVVGGVAWSVSVSDAYLRAHPVDVAAWARNALRSGERFWQNVGAVLLARTGEAPAAMSRTGTAATGSAVPNPEDPDREEKKLRRDVVWRMYNRLSKPKYPTELRQEVKQMLQDPNRFPMRDLRDFKDLMNSMKTDEVLRWLGFELPV